MNGSSTFLCLLCFLSLGRAWWGCWISLWVLVIGTRVHGLYSQMRWCRWKPGETEVECRTRSSHTLANFSPLCVTDLPISVVILSPVWSQQTEKCVSSFQTPSPEPDFVLNCGSLFGGAQPNTILPLLQDKACSQIFDWSPSLRQLLCPLCLWCRDYPQIICLPRPGEQAARL